MQQQLHAELASNGYSQYEVSAYSKADKRCQHNLNYWQFGDYLGIGAGAHGKLTLDNGDVSRAWKIKHPNTYIARENKVGARETVAAQQLPFEFMMNALRLNNGFEVDTFTLRCKLSQQAIQPLLDKHQSE
jgi:oxygen-independent coproporphyrinogen-3 oxidase